MKSRIIDSLLPKVLQI